MRELPGFSIPTGAARAGCVSLGPETQSGDAIKWSNFSRMRSEGSRFIWGSGGEAVFAESCLYVRNRSQPSATVRNRLRVRRKALHSGECTWSDPENV